MSWGGCRLPILPCRPCRWLHQANPNLSTYITELLGSNAWLRDLSLLAGLRAYADKDEVQRQWMDIKRQNKARVRVCGDKRDGRCRMTA
jgi:glucan phosphorylase